MVVKLRTTFNNSVSCNVSILLLVLLVMGNGRYKSPEAASIDLDSDWEELFGHLATGAPKILGIKDKTVPSHEKNGQSKSNEENDGPPPPPPLPLPPAPPAPPFVYNASDGKIPSVGANSYGNMAGIAISQNRGISLGIYMVNSSYNSFNTVFGNSKITKSLATLPSIIPTNE